MLHKVYFCDIHVTGLYIYFSENYQKEKLHQYKFNRKKKLNKEKLRSLYEKLFFLQTCTHHNVDPNIFVTTSQSANAVRDEALLLEWQPAMAAA